MKNVKITCPLDCFDLCQIDVMIQDNKIVSIKGDPGHDLTDGVICKKGLDHLKRHYSNDRLLSPRIKTGNGWQDISYNKAISIFADKIKSVESKSILHYTDAGYGGLSKSVSRVFFNKLGSISTHRGSLCWSAGMHALQKNIGEIKGMNYHEVSNSDYIVLWGRNVADTNLHLFMKLKKAKSEGKKVIYIDPIKTATAKFADIYLQINPDSDRFLVYGILKLSSQKIINRLDKKSLDILNRMNIEEVVLKTNVSTDKIQFLADIFCEGELNILSFLGYGLQRYKNGAETVESILKLHYFTEKINKKGCGINYADNNISKRINNPYIDKTVENVTFVKSKFASFLKDNESIRMIFIDKSNPVTQLPNTNEVIAELDNVPFKVGIDMFMTDTMEMMDLVFPAISIFETEDVIYSSMFSPYIQYSQKCLEPINGILSEYDLFYRLAEQIGLAGYPFIDIEDYLKTLLDGILAENKISYSEFKKIGKLDFSRDLDNDKDEIEFLDVTLRELTNTEVNANKDYNLRLITPHSKNSLHSQGFKDYDGLPIIHFNQQGYENGELIIVASKYGKLKCKVKIDELCLPDVAYIYEGYWNKSGIVNRLTTDEYSNYGDQAAYYDTFIRIEGKVSL
ncbi:MAG: molybdopterin-dependent oxidoreductase [Eubacteriaceae bacterium]|nr:molybdopterin-dependent oxidoreductase [Eubacteriaceae bacterium]